MWTTRARCSMCVRWRQWRHSTCVRHRAIPHPGYVHIWRHFAVLTSSSPVGQNRDHLFLVREGWLYQEIWKFKVMTFERVFETGSMPGLMGVFSRHSGIWTNFKILLVESRPYWSWGGVIGWPVLWVLCRPPAATLTHPPGYTLRGHHGTLPSTPREAPRAGPVGPRGWTCGECVPVPWGSTRYTHLVVPTQPPNAAIPPALPHRRSPPSPYCTPDMHI